MSLTKYEKDFPERAEKYMSEGHTEAQLAKHLGISVATLENYKIKYVEFLEALKRGKIPIDDEVEAALYRRALGYNYDEVHYEKTGKADLSIKLTDDEISGIKTDPNFKVRVITKHVLPDVTAQIFWLKNRRPLDWRDKKDIDLNANKTFADLIKAIHDDDN